MAGRDIPQAPADAGGSGGVPGRALAAILALAFLLQLCALSHVKGYPLADSVEYLERAEMVLAGTELDPGTVRSFAFSALLVPVVVVMRVFGDGGVLFGARLMQMLLGLATIVVVARLGTRILSSSAGLAAAFVLAVNPVFMQWTIEPLSGTAAMLFTALAANAAVTRGGFRRGLVVGAWLGAGILMKFQVLLILGGFLLVLGLRERWKGRSYLAGLIAAAAAMLLLQASMDYAVYGAFGSSLWSYFLENGAALLGTKIYEMGQKLGIDALSQLGLDIYNAVFENTNQSNQTARIELRSLNPRDWYVTHLPSHFLVWPILCVVGLGVARAVFRARWILTLLLVTLFLNVYFMTSKGSQSFRLWLPLLPMVAVLGGAGWGWLVGPGNGITLRRIVAYALFTAGATMGLVVIERTNLQRHGGYWDAIDHVLDKSDSHAGSVGAAYHWAIRYRGRRNVEHEEVKFAFPLYDWPNVSAENRALVLAEIAELDWFLCHQQLFEQDAAIADTVNAHFDLDAAFYDHEAFEDLLPVYVFRRSDPAGGSGGRKLFDIDETGDPSARQASLSYPRSVDLRRRLEDGSVDQLVLLGWEAEILPGSENVGWLTLHWYAGPIQGHDYTFNVRLTDPDDRARQVNHPPAWGARPTSTWPEGAVVADALPFLLPASWDDLGGTYCRGDQVPLRLWIATPRYERDEEGVERVVGGLAPFHPSGLRPVHKERREGRLVSDEGWIFSRDNLVLVGGLWLSVPKIARIPDDGAPLGDS